MAIWFLMCESKRPLVQVSVLEPNIGGCSIGTISNFSSSVCMYVRSYISIHPFIYLYLSLCLSVCLSGYMFIYAMMCAKTLIHPRLMLPSRNTVVFCSRFRIYIDNKKGLQTDQKQSIVLSLYERNIFIMFIYRIDLYHFLFRLP